MPFEFQVPLSDGAQLGIQIEPGTSVIFVGANGGGKTRLAVRIEGNLGDRAHRISAHRALSLNPTVQRISERHALLGLRTGYAGNDSNVSGYRLNNRWRQQAEIALLQDFDFLIQALFGDQANRALSTHVMARAGNFAEVMATKLEVLAEAWERLLPHRKLHISGDDILVSASTSMTSERYSASDMSDGERAVFYMIGQTLMAAADSLLIVDEPELHVHRSIMSKLWDELESLRPDCSFVFITHDLEFAAARSAKKFVIRNYVHPDKWDLTEVPEETGFSEEISTLILGSRRPILFVEGSDASLDIAIYRSCYPEWTLIPRGSCEEVIHSVVTMRANQTLTRITCAGIVDSDGHTAEDINYLEAAGIAVLPVAEIENILLMPTVGRAIAEHEGHKGDEANACLESLKRKIFESMDAKMLESVVTRHCKRRLDRLMKKIGLDASRNVAALAAEFAQAMQSIDVTALAGAIRTNIEVAIRSDDLPELLKYYDNKGLFALAASQLKKTSKDAFESWLTRVLRNGSVPALTDAFKSVLPVIQAS